MKKRMMLISIIGLCIFVLAGSLFIYISPFPIYGQATEGAILTKDDAILRARLMTSELARIDDVRLTLRKDLHEIVFDTKMDSYPPSGEFAAADSPVWVVVVTGDMRDALPFFQSYNHDGTVLALDAATGVVAGIAGFARGTEDEDVIRRVASLEDLDGKIEITPIDLREIGPPVDDTQLNQ